MIISSLKKVAIGVFLLILSVIMVSGIYFTAELAYRSTGYNPNRAALIDVELFPYSNYVVYTQPRSTSFGNTDSIVEGYFGHGTCDTPDGVTARFNSDGFRSPEFPKNTPKKPNEIRIIITGGSAAVSWNIGETCTLDNLLKRRLEDALPGTEVNVYNLASGGYKSFQELIAVLLHGLDFEPDVVIHFSGFNDSFHPVHMPVNQPYSGLGRVGFDRYKNWLYATPQQLLGEFRIGAAVKTLLSSAPISLSKPGDSELQAPKFASNPGPGRVNTALSMPLDLDGIAMRTDFDPYNQQAVDNYMKNEQVLARALSGRNAKLLSVLQPTLYLKTPLAEHETKMMTPGTGFGYAPSVNFTVQAYLRMRNRLAALARIEDNTEFLNLSTAFQGMNEEMFGDNVHFYKKGYEIVADRILPFILKQLESKSRTAN